MFKKVINQILIIFAVIILVAVGFTIYLQSQSSASSPSPSEVSRTRDKNENMEQEKIVRQPAVAGAFYPASKKELEETINQFLGNVEKKVATGTPRILIVPHAGYSYSGQVAASSFKQLVGQGFTKAIILGPSHNFPAKGLVLSDATHWQTPLGLIKISEVNKQLAKEDNFTIDGQVHEPEHALEVEIPFLQTVIPNIEIVPIIVGQLNLKQQSDFADVLASYLDSQTVLIVSVDLSHYHPYDEAKELDQQSINHILNLDSAGILADEIDASWAIASVLKLVANKGWQPELMNYANSGDVTGDKSQVVGYSSFIFK